MYPKSSQFAVEAYRDATREPYSYLLVDLRPEQDRVATENKHFSRRDSLRIRSEGIKGKRIRRQVQSASRDRTKMSRRVKKFLPVLRRIRKMGYKVQRDYIKKCNREFIDCVSECAKKRYKRQRSDDWYSESKLASKKK